MRDQILRDIIGLMNMGFDTSKVQGLIEGAYGCKVNTFDLWKIYHRRGA